MSLTLERIKELDDQVMEIAWHLGMEWDQEYSARQEQSWNYNAEIKSGNKRISFSTRDTEFHGRFIIRGVFPRDKRGQFQHSYHDHDKRHEITVAMDRGAEKIAHAIQSRLLPEYEKQLLVALERIKKSDAYHAGRLQVLKVVAEYFGHPMPEDDDKAIYPPIEDGLLGIYKIEANFEGGIKFDVSCTVEKALRIFEILKQS